MDTLKTGFIVVLLLAVLYGVYVVLNKDQAPPTAEIAWHQQEAEKELQVEVGPPSTPEADTNKLVKDAPAPPVKEDAAVAKDVAAPLLRDAATPPAKPTATFAETSPPSLNATATAPDVNVGIPHVIKAELTPVENSPTAPSLAPSPLRPSTGDPTVPPIDEPPLPSATAGTVPSASGPISPPPPTLLKSNSKLITNPTLDGGQSTQPRSNPYLQSTTTSSADTTQPPLIQEAPDGVRTTPTDSSGRATGFGTSTSPATTDSADAGPGIKPISTAAAFAAAMREAHTNIEEEKWYQALFILSKFYNSPDLSSEQHQTLLDLLDPLAAKVVYSQEHLVTDAHVVLRGETLEQIAQANQIPVDLIANINGLDKSGVLIPGTKVKIVQGPFRADVDLKRQELTLFAGQLYAGRFPVSVGKEPEPQPGEFRVLEKQTGKDYYGDKGQVLRPDDPANPYGHVWIALGQELAIHGSPDRGEGTSQGCISLSPLDAHDVFSILSEGSAVTIRR